MILLRKMFLYTTTSRLVVYLGVFSHERQGLWLFKEQTISISVNVRVCGCPLSGKSRPYRYPFTRKEWNTTDTTGQPGLNRGQKLCVIQKTCFSLGAHGVQKAGFIFQSRCTGLNRFSTLLFARVEGGCGMQLGTQILVATQVTFTYSIRHPPTLLYITYTCH